MYTEHEIKHTETYIL